jgi:hypothetical protein
MIFRLLDLITNIQTCLFGIGVVLAFLKFSTRALYIKMLGLAMFVSVFFNIVTKLLFTLGSNPNSAGNFYYLVAFPIITMIYYIATKQKHMLAYITLVVLYITFGLINIFYFQQEDINSYTLWVTSIAVILYALYYFYWLIKELPTIKLHKLPMFWINSAYIIFFSGNLVLYVFTSYLANVLRDNFSMYWLLHNLLGVVQAIIFIVAVSIDLKNHSSATSAKQ